MAEEKPFEPSARKLEKARKEGNVARSSELNGIIAFGAGLLALVAVAPLVVQAIRTWLSLQADGGGRMELGPLAAILGLTAVPLAAAGIAGAATAVLQMGGPIFVAPTFKLERLRPDEGVKRMFSVQSLVTVGKSLLAFGVAATGVAVILRTLLGSGIAGSSDPSVFGGVAAWGVKAVLGALMVIGGVFAIADVLIVRSQWRKKLRMDLYELKHETKDSEGDPHFKGRRRSTHRELLKGSIKRVAEASFVVTNPTHIAVALKYQPPSAPVPVVVCMAAEEKAQSVKAVARECGIPIIENVSLARMLFATAEIDRTIPEDTFIAVAEIVSALTRTES